MSATYDSNLSVSLDAPLSALSERGHGAHLHPAKLTASYVNLTGPKGARGIFLWPIQTQPGSTWKTTFTGANTRKRLSTVVSYTNTGTVTDFEWGAASDWWQRMNAGATLTTTGAGWTGGASGYLRPNPWLHLAFWVYGTHATNDEVLTLEWGLAGSKFKLHIYGTGAASLERGSEGTVAWGVLFSNGVMNKASAILIAPLFHRCLYFWGAGKGELVFEDLSIDPNATDATGPSAASPLVGLGTCKITAVVRAEVQLSECVFPATGSMLAPISLPYAPTAAAGGLNWTNADSVSLHKSDVSGTGTYVATAPTLTISALLTGTSTAWTANGVRTAFDLKAAFTAGQTPDGYNRITPVLYTTGFRFDPLGADRPDNTATWLNYVKAGATLTVDGERSHLNLTILGAEALRTKQNRFIILGCGTDEVFRGYAGDPSWALSEDVGATPMYAVTYNCEDEWKRLEKILVPASYDFGGMLWTSAVKYLLMYAGYPTNGSRWNIDASAFTLPKKDTNEQAVQIDVSGDTEGGGGDMQVDTTAGMASEKPISVAEWLRNLRDEYSNWDMGFVPVAGIIKFVAWDPAGASVTGTFYTTTAASLSYTSDQRNVARNLKERLQEPEANEIHVWGQAPGGGTIHSQWPGVGVANPDADPTLAEGSRSFRWVGEPRIVQLIDPALNTQALCDAALVVLYRRLVPAVDIVTFDSEWHPGIHVFDLVTVDAATYRVTGYTVHFEGETTMGGSKARSCEYEGQRYR